MGVWEGGEMEWQIERKRRVKKKPNSPELEMINFGWENKNGERG